MDCVIYMRWSSAEQSKGSTLERQTRDCREYAAAQGWNVIDELVDDGISAYKGEHANSGRLGDFVRAVEAGEYPEGVILLCEKLDRLSRQTPSRVFLWMIQLTEAGVVIATVDGGRQYSNGQFDMAAIIEVVVKAQLAHEESEKKSHRLAAAWEAKRRRLQAGESFVMSRRIPGWLRVEGTPPRFVVDETRAAIVRRIFEETAGGYGKHHIARNLNRDGIAPFGRADGWHASYVQKILKTIAVLGEFQPSRKPRGSPREAVGDVIKGYYPPVIDAALHGRAMAAMADRSRRTAGRGRRLVNLFSGLAHCGVCGSKMTFRGKGSKIRADGSVVSEDYLICDSYQRGRGCGNGTHFNYRLWEDGILGPTICEALWERHAVPNAQVNELEIALAEAERQQQAVRAKAALALDLALETDRQEPRSAWLTLVAEADLLDAEIDSMRDRLTILRGQVTPEENIERITALQDALHDDDDEIRFEARSKIMSALQNLLNRITFNPPASVVVDILGEREAHIDYNDLMGDTEWIISRNDGQPFSSPWRVELEAYRQAHEPDDRRTGTK